MRMHATAPLICTKMKTSSLQRNYHYHYHWKPPVQPATKMKKVVATVHEWYGNRITSITPCQCSQLKLLLRPPGPQSVIKGLPQHPGHRISDFCSQLLLQINQSISSQSWLHKSIKLHLIWWETYYELYVFNLSIKCWGNLFNNFGIWCLETLQALLVWVGYKWSRSWFRVSISCNSWLYLLSKVNIWNVNFARATAFILDTRTGVLVKVPEFLRQKMSRPEGDSNPQPSDSCRML